MAPSQTENLITTKEAGEIYGYTPDYLARLARSGKISGKRIGHSWLIERESLESFTAHQDNHKIDRARALTRAREAEYREHRAAVRHATRALMDSMPMPLVHAATVGKLRSQALALSVALLVIVMGALGARAAALPRLARVVAEIANETATGFDLAFGDISSRIIARVGEVETDRSAFSERIAANITIASENLASSSFSFVGANLSLPQIALVEERRVLSPVAFVAHPGSITLAPITIEDVQASVLAVYEFITTPSLAASTLARAHAALGADAYVVINESFSAYRALVERAGEGALALAATTRDTLATTQRIINRMNLAFGETVIDAAHTALRADVALAYWFADSAPASARLATELALRAGDALSSATSRVPALATALYLRATATPAELAPRFARAIFSAEYDAVERFLVFSRRATEGYLAIVDGAGRLAYAGAERAETLVPTSTRLVSGLAAVANGLSAGERAALSTYETISGFMRSAQGAFASLFIPSSPPAIVIPSLPAGRQDVPQKARVAVATSTPRAAAPAPQIVNSYPTYTTVVQASPSGSVALEGVSQDSLARSLATLRADILATAAGMIQPVAAQTAANVTTIQQVNMIQDLSNLIVRNGDFRGGVFDNGERVSATTGTFTNLNGGSLSVSGTATSTFSGNISVAGNINLNGALLQDDAPFVGSQWTTSGSSIYYTAGFVGIGTTSPGSLLSIGGTGTGWNFFDNATTTSYAKGIDLKNGGCFAVNGVCVGSGAGTVTSIDMTVPTGLTISGNPITTSGTLALALTAGYSIPTTANQTSWSNKWDLASTTIGVAYGGTGATTLTGLLQGNGTSAITGIAGTVGQFPYYNGTNTLIATSSIFLATSGNVGIGTTSPLGLLSVHAPPSIPSFVIGSSTATSFIVDAFGRVGVGTTSPASLLAVAGSSYLGTGATSVLTVHGGQVNYFLPATSTIASNQKYAWTIATSTSAAPLLRFDTNGPRATTSIASGFSVGNGALEYDFTSGVTSIDSLQTGPMSFDTDAGIVSWVDMPVATTTSGIIMSYSAQIDTNSALTVYGTTDGSGGVANLGVGIGTTTPQWLLNPYSATASQLALSAGAGIAQWAFRNAGGNLYFATTTVAGTATTSTSALTILGGGNVGIGDTSPDQLLEVLSSGAANTQLSIGNTNAGNYDAQIGFELADGTNTFTMGVDDSDSDKFKISTTALGTNDRLVIDSSGYVGINTATPYAPLDIAGTTRISGGGKALLIGQYSDDFNESTLASVWTITDPVGDSTINTTANSGKLTINVPTGTHDCYGTTVTCARVLRSVSNNDAEYVVKIDGNDLTTNIQTYGIMLVQDFDAGAQDYIRFEYVHSGGVDAVAAYKTIAGSGSTAISDVAVTMGTVNYLRVRKVSTTYYLDYSVDGKIWTNAGSFTVTFTVNQAGVGISQNASPSGTIAQFDYFSVTETGANLHVGGIANLSGALNVYGTSSFISDAFFSGNVGIGTANPGAKLQLHATAGNNIAFRMSDADISLPSYSSVGFDPSLGSNDIAQWSNFSGTTGGFQLSGFTSSGTNNGTPVALMGYHGGNAPTTAAINLIGYKWDGGTNRTALADSELILQISNAIGTPKVTVLGNGNVGIGDTTPDAKLEVSGGALFGDTTSYEGGVYIGLGGWPYAIGAEYSSANDTGALRLNPVGYQAGSSYFRDLIVYNGKGTEIAFFDGSNGRVGIGDTTPDYGLDVVTDINSDDCFREAGTQVAGTCASDSRLKQNIVPLSGALGRITSLNPVSFEWRPEVADLGGTFRYVAGRQVGLIAQDIQSIYPHLVEEKNGYLAVEYNLELQMETIGAIRELNAKLFLLPTGATTTLPAEVLTAGGDGIDLYKLATYNLSSVQALAERVGAVEMRLESLEERLSALESGAAGSASFSASFASLTEQLKSWLASAGNGIGDIFAKAFYASEKICVDDQCLTKDDVKNLLALVRSQTANVSTDNALPADTTAPVTATASTTDSGQADSATPAPEAPAPEPSDVTPPAASDVEPPIVTLVGDAALQMTVGDAFTDPGATATDDMDGDLTTHINVSGAVDATVAGLYELAYSATDAAGNTGSVSRVVTVIAAPPAPADAPADTSSSVSQ